MNMVEQLHEERQDMLFVSEEEGDAIRLIFVSKHLYDTGKHEIGEIWFHGDDGATALEQHLANIDGLLQARANRKRQVASVKGEKVG